MENDLKTESLQESLNKKLMNKSVSIASKEEEIKNNSIEKEINLNRSQKINEEKKEEKNIKIEINKEKEEEEKIQEINKDDNEKDKKINNKRVNNLLKDIYGSLYKINEVNDRVKNLLEKRKKMNSVNSFRKGIKEEKENNIKNKRKSITTYKKKPNYNIKENIISDEYSTTKIGGIYNRNTYNSNEITKNETASVNLKSKNTNIYQISKLDNTSTENQTKKNNPCYPHKMYTPEPINRTKKEFNQTKSYKYDELLNNENSARFNEKNNDISNINDNSGFYEEEYENEKIIRYMRIKLKNEEKKLKVLEDQKNKLLNEEKHRRKLLMEKIRNKNRIKKKCLINEYKNKISLIQKLQTNNINEIRKLEIKKKIDEDNIIKIDKICENININDSTIKTNTNTNKSQIRNSLTKSRLDNSSDGINYLLSDSETQQRSNNKKMSSNYHIFSNNNLVRNNSKKNRNNNNNETEEALTEDYPYQFNNSINELTSTCDMIDENESFSHSQVVRKSSYKRKLNFDDSAKTQKGNINPFNYLYNYYQKINKDNNRKFYKNENMNVDNYLNQNSRKKKKYHSETRKYEKSVINTNSSNTKRKTSGNSTPNQEVLSFIKTRVNKYNHSSNKEANISKRLSQMTAYPSYLINNFNCKYNYKYTPSTVSRTNGFKDKSRKSTQRNERNKGKHIKELNFKYIFLNDK